MPLYSLLARLGLIPSIRRLNVIQLENDGLDELQLPAAEKGVRFESLTMNHFIIVNSRRYGDHIEIKSPWAIKKCK